MISFGSLNENKIQEKQEKIEFDCSKHTNGKSGTIGEKYYDKIFCLDNKMKLAEIYKILHNKNNFGPDVAFVLNSDLDFSGANLANLNSGYNYTGNTFAPIEIESESYQFNADFYGNNHKIIVGDINYSDKNSVGFFGYIGEHGKVYDLNLKIGNVSGSDSVGGFVGDNYHGTITNSSAVVNSVKGNKYFVGGFVGYNHYGKILNSVARVLVLSGASGNVSAGYYTNDNLAGNSTKINKQEFFFGDKKGLSYDGTTLIITSPTDTEYNDTNYSNYNNTIMSNLSKYWDTNGWKK